MSDGSEDQRSGWSDGCCGLTGGCLACCLRFGSPGYRVRRRGPRPAAVSSLVNVMACTPLDISTIYPLVMDSIPRPREIRFVSITHSGRAGASAHAGRSSRGHPFPCRRIAPAGCRGPVAPGFGVQQRRPPPETGAGPCGAERC